MKKFAKILAFIAMCSIFTYTFASTIDEKRAYLKTITESTIHNINNSFNLAVNHNYIDFDKVELIQENNKVIDLKLSENFIDKDIFEVLFPNNNNKIIRFKLPNTDKYIQLEEDNNKIKAYNLTQKEVDAIESLNLPIQEQTMSSPKVKMILDEINWNIWSVPTKESLVLACDARVFVNWSNECK